MSGTPILRLDFARQGPCRAGIGVLICALGLCTCIGVGVLFSTEIQQRERLEGAIESVASQHHARSESPGRAAEQAELAKINRQLEIPWSSLLAELEAASKDMANAVSLLQIEPDPDKRTVRITAEVRSLPDALAYLRRLQQSKLLRYPMLESHELIKDDPEHAIRIKLAAEWHA